MAYKIKTWIPCEEERVTTYFDKEEADSAVDNMSMMQPENIYNTVKCDEFGEDI